MRALAVTIVAAHVVLLLGPPLISQDVFGYLGFARLGILHGLDPYSHVPAQAAFDPIYPFLGWPHQHPPYGPLFTLISYAFAPLGIAGGIWAFKVLAALASLGAIWLVARAAGRMGYSPVFAAAFVGLNPVLLELAVGGDHNDTLVMLLLSGALALTAAVAPAGRIRAREGPAAPAQATSRIVLAEAGAGRSGQRSQPRWESRCPPASCCRSYCVVRAGRCAPRWRERVQPAAERARGARARHRDRARRLRLARARLPRRVARRAAASRGAQRPRGDRAPVRAARRFPRGGATSSSAASC